MFGLPLIVSGAVLASVHELNVVGAALSFRALILLPILAYLAVPRLRGVKLEHVAFVIGLFTIFNALLGIAQNSSTVDAPINYYASEAEGAVAYEENVRAMGTFSYITGFANFAEAGSWAGLSLLCLARGRLSYILAGWVFYLASLICALVSISRGTVLIVLAMLVVLGVSGKALVGNLFKGIAAAAILIGVGYALSFNPLVERLSDTVIARHESSDDTIEMRTVGPFLESGLAIEMAPLGSGFGTEQVAGVYAETGIMSMRRFESQFARLVMETGLVGLIGFLVICAGTVYVLFRIRRHVDDEGLRRVLVLTAFTAASYFYTNVAFNHIASYLAWLIVAVSLASATNSVAVAKITSRGPLVPTAALPSGIL
jgi:O-antigen ligase